MDVTTSAPFRRDRKQDYQFLCEELIGLSALVLGSPCKGLRGLEGKVVDETKGTFVLRTPKGDKTVPKKGSVFQFAGHKDAAVKGDWLCFRPEDRTKKVADLLRRNRLR
jgi:ribonuclease P protein subunit POP4